MRDIERALEMNELMNITSDDIWKAMGLDHKFVSQYHCSKCHEEYHANAD